MTKNNPPHTVSNADETAAVQALPCSPGCNLIDLDGLDYSAQLHACSAQIWAAYTPFALEQTHGNPDRKTTLDLYPQHSYCYDYFRDNARYAMDDAWLALPSVVAHLVSLVLRC